MASNVFMLTALGIAENGFNHLLEMDPVAINRISKLEGKRIELRCINPNLTFVISFTSTGIHLSPEPEADLDCNANDMDTVITGSAAELFGLLSAPDKAAYLRGSDIQISGDIDLSAQLQALMEDIDIDWEARIAAWIGDIPAHMLAGQLKAFLSWGQQTGRQFNRHLEEYLHEEARVVPPAAEVEAFYEEIHQLVVDTDRLGARLARINALDSPSTSDNAEQA